MASARMVSPRMKFVVALVFAGWLGLILGDADDWHWTVGNWPEGGGWGEGCYFVGKDNPFIEDPPPLCEPNTEYLWDPELWQKYVEEHYRLQQEGEEQAAAEEGEDGTAGAKTDEENLKAVLL